MYRLEGYENVDHVLRVLAEFHRQFAELTNEFGGSQDDRRGLKFQYVASQHSQRAKTLADFRSGTDATVLESWFQVPFPENPDDFIRRIRSRVSEEVALEDLLAEVDSFTDRLLQHLHDRAETDSVIALFQDLLNSERQNRKLRSRGLGSFASL